MLPRWRLAAVAMVVGCALVALLTVVSDLPELAHALVLRATHARDVHPVGVALAALGTYALWIVAFLPTTLFELALGFVFGLSAGYAIDLGGKLIGSAVSYVLGRSVLRACVRWMLGSHPLLASLEGEVIARPYRTALLLRLAYVPISLKNYGQALLGVPPIPFVLILLPVELVDTYIPIALGASAVDLAALLRGDLSGASAVQARWQLALLAIAILATAALLGRIAALARRAVEDDSRTCTCCACSGSSPTAGGERGGDDEEEYAAPAIAHDACGGPSASRSADRGRNADGRSAAVTSGLLL